MSTTILGKIFDRKQKREVKLFNGTILRFERIFLWKGKWMDDRGNEWVRRNDKFYQL